MLWPCSNRNLENKERLAALGIAQLRPFQKEALNTIAKGADTQLVAPTGSGKTLAYLLPLVSKLDPALGACQAMVLVPSRELALQVTAVWQSLQTGAKVLAMYGGHEMAAETNSLTQMPALIVGTPGRIADHFHRKTFGADQLKVLVLDEFDKCLSLGFEKDMADIRMALPKKIQQVLVSATAAVPIPEWLGFWADKIVASDDESPADRLAYYEVAAPEKDKLEPLLRLLSVVQPGPVLVFCNHRDAAERTAAFLKENKVPVGLYHGGMEQVQRELALIRFRNGTDAFLVATDLAARGLDIPELPTVVHYHLPHTATEFIHRNGRTARNSQEGKVYWLLHESEKRPDFLPDPEAFDLPAKPAPFPAPLWDTVFVAAGKKQKINKTDIVGFFCKTGKLPAQDLGLIVVQDNSSFVAVKAKALSTLLPLLAGQKIKGQKCLVKRAR
ncbi:MAG: DEAD/DEAH box helicase [Sphingobacteriia bacterium]|nr:MAG: DEAD/DEAH box helicase [Sphingobacteriia bacterium]